MNGTAIMSDTPVDTLTVTVSISPDISAGVLAAELRKVRDALNRAYRNALLEDKMPIYHPVMQGLAISAMQMEGVVNLLDPPMVQRAGAVPQQFMPGSGRA